MILYNFLRVSVETLTTDINNIANKVRAISEQISVAGMDFQDQMREFLKVFLYSLIS